MMSESVQSVVEPPARPLHIGPISYPFKRCWSDLRAEVRFRSQRGYLNRCFSILFKQDLQLVALYRIGRYFEARNNPRIARILIFLQQRFCSCQISPFASLRVGVIFPHPLGVVIGDGAVVEEGAWIFQQVTLGGKRTIDEDQLERITYPIVRRGAKLYPQSMAIGAITIGANAIVGAQSLVLADVPEGATVAGSPARIL